MTALPSVSLAGRGGRVLPERLPSLRPLPAVLIVACSVAGAAALAVAVLCWCR